MRKKIVILTILSSISLATVTAISLSVSSIRYMFSPLANQGSNYTLNLGEQKISNQNSAYPGEISTNVLTNNNNPIEFKCSNVINYASGWQTILPGGYFYNPLTSSSAHNKITGIESIRFNSNENKNLSLSYGYTLDNENIIYTYEKDLVANETYSLNGLNPSYLYVKNNNDSNVNITDFDISYSCSESVYPKQNLNILMIGNSFADDTVFFSKRAAASYGITLNIFDAYIASCDIDKHYSNLTNDKADYSMRSTNGDEWSYQDNMTLSQIINSNTWDIITFQQASAQVGRTGTYSNLSNLVSSVRSLVGSNPKFYWYQTWAYDDDYHEYYDYFSYFGNDSLTMYNALCTRYREDVEPLHLFEKMIPAGTAVENLRTSYMKETFSRDGKHMSHTHGRYLLSLNFLSHIYDIDFAKSPCSYKPEGVRDSFNLVAYEAIKNAQKNPLNLTTSLYQTRELEGYNLADFTEIDAELVGCSYWNSTDDSNYNKRIANDSQASNHYVSTKRFTSSTLPVGSIVVIDDAFGVRPEAWTSDSKQSSRPNEVYSNVVEIDSDFWSGYQYRAFNIFKVGKPSLSGQYVDEQYDEIFDGFHVYVPNNQMSGLNPKDYNPSFYSDSSLFYNFNYKIDSYERIHLDPITGFYKCDSYYYLMNSFVDNTAKQFVCTRPFYSSKNELPENTILVVDSGYQWRSDCWTDQGTCGRPGNVSNQLTVLDSSFMDDFRNRTFNVSSTNGYYVNQNHRGFMDHFRIYVPISDDIYVKEPEPEPEPEIGSVNGPDGTYKAVVEINGNNIPLVVSIGKTSTTKIAVRLNNADAQAATYSYDESNNILSITTSGYYGSYEIGTISGVYDKTNDVLTSISINGALSSYVLDNGSIVCEAAETSSNSFFANCDGTTSELQAQFKRRYMIGSWQVDNSNADRITSNTDEFISGNGSITRRGYSSNAVALNLNSDFASSKTVSRLQFWVYNPSGNNITLRLWVYRATGLGSNREIDSTTAKANQWTYVSIYFSSESIYNFQIADFTNSGVYLSFDNIYLF